MNIPQEISQFKPHIDTVLIHYLVSQQKQFHNINNFAEDACQRLIQFTTKGKTIRGCFIPFTAQIVHKPVTEDLFILGAVVELIHSALLIHDDIMDHDRLRRGKKTIFVQYADKAKHNNITHNAEYGNSIAMCIGDFAIFLAYSLLSTIQNKKQLPQLLTLFSNEFSIVTLAQMQDVHFGLNTSIPIEQSILSLYTYKTARYTFSLPFLVASSYLNISRSIQTELDTIGQDMGLMYQMTDDMLNIFSKTTVSGKSIRSDIINHKKTFYLSYLVSHAGNADRKILYSIINQKKITKATVATMYSMLEKYQIHEYMLSYIHKHKLSLIQKTDKLFKNETHKSIFNNFISYISQRTS